METVYDSFTSIDAANEVCGKLEFDGQNVYVRQVGELYLVIIVM